MNQKGSPIFFFEVNFGNLIFTTQVGYKKSRESRHLMHEHDRSTTLLLPIAFIIQNVQLQGTLEEHGKIEYSIHLSSRNKLKRSMPSIYYLNQYQSCLKRFHNQLFAPYFGGQKKLSNSQGSLNSEKELKMQSKFYIVILFSLY